MAGRQTVTEWQDSQLLLERMCVGFLPVACVPLWQLTQLPVMPLCAKFAGRQAVVVWQLSQLLSLTICVAFLPIAVVPLWQLKQVPVTCE